ncbi:hypothetical protein VPH35_087042 [Triticum aestivum]
MFRSWSGARSPHVSSLVVLHHVASPVCWSYWTEVDDFLAAKNLSALYKIMLAKCRAAPDLPMPHPWCFFVMLHLRCDGPTGQRLTTSWSRSIRPHSTRSRRLHVGAGARLEPASEFVVSEFVVGRSPKDPIVICVFSRVLIPLVFFNI